MPEAVEPGAFAPDDLRPEEIPRDEERPGSAGGLLSPGIRPVSRQACPATGRIATGHIAAFHVATGRVTTRRVQPGVQQQAEQFRYDSPGERFTRRTPPPLSIEELREWLRI